MLKKSIFKSLAATLFVTSFLSFSMEEDSPHDFASGLASVMRPNWIILAELNEALGSAERRENPLFIPKIFESQKLVGELIIRQGSGRDLIRALEIVCDAAYWYRSELDAYCSFRCCLNQCSFIGLLGALLPITGISPSYCITAVPLAYAVDTIYSHVVPPFSQKKFLVLIQIIQDILKTLTDQDITLDAQTLEFLRKNFGTDLDMKAILESLPEKQKAD